MNTNSVEFDFENDLIILDTIADYLGKKLYVVTKIFAFLQHLVNHPDFADNKYLEKLQIEEKRLDETDIIEKKRKKKLKKSCISVVSKFKECPVSVPIVPENPEKQAKRKIINDHLLAADILKWEYFCEAKSEYLLMLDIFTDFFADHKVTLDLHIEMQEGCMTKLCHILNTIYHELCPRTLKNNKDFYNLLRNLSIFKNKSNNVIYNTLKS